jgi:hypothetical protein
MSHPVTYSKMLFQLPAERLREIVTRRARTLRTIPRIEDKLQLCSFLSEALSVPSSISAAVEMTDRLQLQVLTFAVIQSGVVTFDAVVERLGEEARERLWEAVNGLESLGLVLLRPIAASSERLGGDRALYVPTAVRSQTPLPLPLRRMLPGPLEQYDATAVGVIYDTLGLQAPGATTKAARVKAITDALTDPLQAQAVVSSLSEAAVSMLDFVVSQGGATSLSQIALRLESRQRNQLYSYDWAARWYHGKPRNAVEELLAHGLLVFDGAVGWGYGNILVPGNVLPAITGRPIFATGAVRIPEWETIPAEGAAIRRHDSLCRDIAYLMGYLGRSEATRTAKGLIHRNVLKSLAKGLTVPTTDYAGFVYSLARESDLIAPHSRTGIYDVTEQGIAWLDLPLDRQLRTLYDVWRSQTAWAENAEEPLTDGQQFYTADETRALRESGIALLRDIHAEMPGRLASIRSAAGRAEYRWWARFPLTIPDEGGDAAPQSTAERVLDRLLAGSLYWLGLTELAEVSGSAQYVRLTNRGLDAFGIQSRDAELDSQTVDTFVVQANLEIFAPPNLAPNLLYRLFRIAEPSSRAGSLLSLSNDTLRRAMDRGETGASILELFRAHSQTGVPQNVEYLINQVGEKHGHIHIGQAGLYIQVSDPVLLKEIQAQKKLNIHFRRQLTDTVALVTGDSVDAILKQLRQAGYLPVSDEEKHAPTKIPASARHVYAPPIETRPAAGPVDRIDWNAVAASDGLEPVESHDEPEPQTAGQSSSQVRNLLERALREHLVLAMHYRPDPRAPSLEREIEPIGLAGSLLRAFDRSKGAALLFNTRYITSLRTTGETFSK